MLFASVGALCLRCACGVQKCKKCSSSDDTVHTLPVACETVIPLGARAMSFAFRHSRLATRGRLLCLCIPSAAGYNHRRSKLVKCKSSFDMERESQSQRSRHIHSVFCFSKGRLDTAAEPIWLAAGPCPKPSSMTSYGIDITHLSGYTRGR